MKTKENKIIKWLAWIKWPKWLTDTNVNRVNLMITTAIGIAALVISCNQSKLAEAQNALTEMTMPIKFDFSSAQTKEVTYTLNSGSISTYLPVIECTSGAINKVVVIGYHENKVHGMGYLDVWPTWAKDYDYEIETYFPENPLHYDTFLYDYFFLYIDAFSGEKQLVLVYYEIDIQNEEVTDRGIYYQYDILRLDVSEKFLGQAEFSPARQEMFSSYQSLLGKLTELSLF